MFLRTIPDEIRTFRWPVFQLLSWLLFHIHRPGTSDAVLGTDGAEGWPEDEFRIQNFFCKMLVQWAFLV